MSMTPQDLARKRINNRGMDPRGNMGTFSRGKNMYPGGSAAVSGPQGPGFGRPPGRMTSQPPQPGPPDRMGRLEGMGMAPAAPEPPVPVSEYTMPFDPAYAEKMREIAQRRAGMESEFGIGQQRLGQDFGTAERGLQEQREMALKALQAKMADQGMTFSGINIGEQGEVGREFQGAMGDLLTQRTRGSEDLTRQFQGGLQGLESETEAANYARIRDMIPQMLEQAYGEAQGQAMTDWLRQFGGVPNPIQFSPTGRSVTGASQAPTRRRPTPSKPAPTRKTPKQKAAIKPTKGAVKRRLDRSR